jgi:hypothetical protein
MKAGIDPENIAGSNGILKKKAVEQNLIDATFSGPCCNPCGLPFFLLALCFRELRSKTSISGGPCT